MALEILAEDGRSERAAFYLHVLAVLLDLWYIHIIALKLSGGSNRIRYRQIENV
jgi:hypothetical protein